MVAVCDSNMEVAGAIKDVHCILYIIHHALCITLVLLLVPWNFCATQRLVVLNIFPSATVDNDENKDFGL